MLSNRHTDTHTDTQTHRPTTVTLAAHARRGLISGHNFEKKAPFATTSFKKGGGLIFKDGPIYKRLWYMSGFQKPFCSHWSVRFAQHAKTIGEFGKAVDIPSLPKYLFHFYTSLCCQDIKLKHRGLVD